MTTQQQPRRRRKRRNVVDRLARELCEAETEQARQKALIDAGETFAGHKPSNWRRAGRSRGSRWA